ncbi:MAG: hypothetical protein QNJ98_01960 [Planctomycetota bacterium]|nr:hypothetical protein [Planctomycetota bacterium]
MVLGAPGDIGQLVILAIVFLGWVVKEVVEARKRKALRTGKPAKQPSARTQPPPRRTEPEADVIYGTRPLPHLPGGERPQPTALRTPTPTPTRAPAPARTRPQPRTDRIRPAEVTGRVSSVVEGGRAIETLTETASTTFTTRTNLARRRDRILERLQVGHVPGSLRDKTRVAILWSEVLGPCRALRGPHRAPTFERTGRR